MNIAMIFQHKLVQGLHRWMQGQAPGVGPQPLAQRSMALPCPRPMARRFDGVAHGATVNRLAARKAMPLRVLRVVDSDQPRNSTGRLVISGRMADVCAELDRLVEREAALH